jgi:pimeloyl-ACP methyl ester carboxylesterase
MEIPVEFLSGEQKIHGAFFLAEGERLLPTVLMLGGFPPGEGATSVGQSLVAHAINTLTFSYRGTGESEGIFSIGNVLEDIQEAFTYLQREDVVRKFKVDINHLILGGLSFGGGSAMAFAANQPDVRRIFAIAGDDYGKFARQYERDPRFANYIDGLFAELQAPAGPIRFDGIELTKELIQNKDRLDLRLQAGSLADRDILLIAGWDDVSVTIEDKILPFYRALVEAEAKNVRIEAFQDDHFFDKSREDIAKLLIEWIKSPSIEANP